AACAPTRGARAGKRNPKPGRCRAVQSRAGTSFPPWAGDAPLHSSPIGGSRPQAEYAPPRRQNMNNPRSISPAPLGALRVVHGDIGTSPLYALREATAVAGGATDVNAMLGVLSLIFWSLLVIISLKYIVFILRMDNDGEGGVLSLVSLVEDKLGGNG